MSATAIVQDTPQTPMVARENKKRDLMPPNVQRTYGAANAERILVLIDALIDEFEQASGIHGPEDPKTAFTSDMIFEAAWKELPPLPLEDDCGTALGAFASFVFGRNVSKNADGEPLSLDELGNHADFMFRVVRACLGAPINSTADTLLVAVGIAIQRRFNAAANAEAKTPSGSAAAVASGKDGAK